MSPQPKVLVFTASAKRPIYLRHCLLQMQQQTYPLDHVVYLNSPEYQSPDQDTHNYLKLLDDIVIAKGKQIHIGYGPTASHHLNHMAAIQLVNWEDYDLFFKVDDDDIYRSCYIQDAVKDYLTQQWDFSGEISTGHINKTVYNKNQSFSHFVSSSSSIESESAAFMPPTFAFSKKALQRIMKLKRVEGSEDEAWKKRLLQLKSIKTKIRSTHNFIYNIHSKNSSQPHSI